MPVAASRMAAAPLSSPHWRQLYKNGSSRKIDSQRLFSREYDFPKTYSLTENQFSGKTYFYTIRPWLFLYLLPMASALFLAMISPLLASHSSWCILLRCKPTDLLDVNDLGQKSHLYGRSPVCVLMWSPNNNLEPNHFLHIVH